MIYNIEYCGSKGLKIKAVVFDQPFDDYYDILLQAATDPSNKLRNNYREDYLSRDTTLFGYILYDWDDKPSLMYFVEREPSLPSNIARCFTRYYVAPNWKTDNALVSSEIWKIIYTKEEGQHNRDAYLFKDHPHILTEYGLDTVFFTRNEKHREKFIQRVVRPAGFHKLDGLIEYRGVYQHFFVSGDPSFANNFNKK